MTPWHEDDMAARLLATETNIRLIRLPVEAEIDDPLGREEGEPLGPEIGKDAKWLEQFKERYLNDPEGGPRAWSALYMCNPRVEGGNLVKREWWKYYDTQEVRTFGTELISVDAAFKGGENNDYVAIEVWGKSGNNYYCQYCLNRHLDFPQTLEAIRTVRQLFPRARTVLIEDKANGSAIISMLQREMFCVAVNPKGGKVARVNAVSSAIESGHVYLPKDASWTVPFVDQFTAFPAGRNDDMVDCATHALTYMIYASGQAELPPAEVDEDERVVAIIDDTFLDGEKCYDVYGGW
jgi:predicted phage terminase large subunit-like protein